ncbi:hypothetical protein HDV00_008366 [Rhizophlyctis rosea]|nr:hypothetical protein HDV00_008366 [Rhizophlyctis rosea]
MPRTRAGGGEGGGAREGERGRGEGPKGERDEEVILSPTIQQAIHHARATFRREMRKSFRTKPRPYQTHLLSSYTAEWYQRLWQRFGAYDGFFWCTQPDGPITLKVYQINDGNGAEGSSTGLEDGWDVGVKEIDMKLVYYLPRDAKGSGQMPFGKERDRWVVRFEEDDENDQALGWDDVDSEEDDDTEERDEVTDIDIQDEGGGHELGEEEELEDDGDTRSLESYSTVNSEGWYFPQSESDDEESGEEADDDYEISENEVEAMLVEAEAPLDPATLPPPSELRTFVIPWFNTYLPEETRAYMIIVRVVRPCTGIWIDLRQEVILAQTPHAAINHGRTHFLRTIASCFRSPLAELGITGSTVPKFTHEDFTKIWETHTDDITTAAPFGVALVEVWRVEDCVGALKEGRWGDVRVMEKKLVWRCPKRNWRWRGPSHDAEPVEDGCSGKGKGMSPVGGQRVFWWQRGGEKIGKER